MENNKDKVIKKDYETPKMLVIAFDKNWTDVIMTSFMDAQPWDGGLPGGQDVFD